MRKCILFLFVLCFSLEAWTKPVEVRKILRIQIKGIINPGSVSYIQMAMEQAQLKGAQALLLELDTPGGLLSSTRDIVKSISTFPMPLIVFIHPGGARATSAGAIISVSSHIVVMANGTNIGAATPVNMGGKDIKGDMAKKAKNDTAALMRSQATLRKRNVKVADQIVQKAISLSPKEALEKNIIDYIARDMTELLQKLDGKKIAFNSKEFVFKTASLKEKDITLINTNYTQKFLNFIADPNISTLLMVVGGMAIYVFVNSGFSAIIPGAIGILALILSFVSLQTIPVNIGAVILLFLGMVFLVTEVFIPSFGILSLGGIMSIAAGALFLVDTASADLQVSWWLIGAILISISIIVFMIGFLFSREKRMKEFYDPFKDTLGTIKELDTEKCSGKVFIQGEIWNFISKEEMKLGDKVSVNGKKGLTLTVKK